MSVNLASINDKKARAEKLAEAAQHSDLFENEDNEELELAKRLSLELHSAREQSIEPKGHQKHSKTKVLTEILDEATNKLIRCFNIIIFHSNQEFIHSIKSGRSLEDIQIAREKVNIIKFIYDGFFSTYCNNLINETIDEYSKSVPFFSKPKMLDVFSIANPIQNLFDEFKRKMTEKQNHGICPCCDENLDKFPRNVLDYYLQQDPNLRMVFDSIYKDFFEARENFSLYFRQNKNRLHSMEQRRRDLSNKLDAAKSEIERLSRENAPASTIRAAKKTFFELQNVYSAFRDNHIAPTMSELYSAINDFTFTIEQNHQFIKAIKATHEQIKESEPLPIEVDPFQKQHESIVQQLEEIRIKAGYPDLLDSNKQIDGNKQKRNVAYLCIHYTIECSKHWVQSKPSSEPEHTEQLEKSKGVLNTQQKATGEIDPKDDMDEIDKHYKNSRNARKRKAI